MNELFVLLCFVIIILVLVNYWTVWKIRRELNQNVGKMESELTQIRELLQKNPADN